MATVPVTRLVGALVTGVIAVLSAFLISAAVSGPAAAAPYPPVPPTAVAPQDPPPFGRIPAVAPATIPGGGQARLDPRIGDPRIGDPGISDQAAPVTIAPGSFPIQARTGSPTASSPVNDRHRDVLLVSVGIALAFAARIGLAVVRRHHDLHMS